MQEKEGKGGREERGSDANDRRFTEDSALGVMMYRMSSATAP